MKLRFVLMSLVAAVGVSCGTVHEAVSEDSSSYLDEQQNVGYGTVSARDNTMAVSTKKVNRQEVTVYNTIYDYLRGRVPGVEVGPSDGGGSASVRIRGAVSINGSTEPLYIVDGAPVDDLSYLNPNDVYSVDVLKDASSAIYGVRGANGVIIVTTLSGYNQMQAEAERKREQRQAARAARKNR